MFNERMEGWEDSGERVYEYLVIQVEYDRVLIVDAVGR